MNKTLYTIKATTVVSPWYFPSLSKTLKSFFYQMLVMKSIDTILDNQEVINQHDSFPFGFLDMRGLSSKIPSVK